VEQNVVEKSGTWLSYGGERLGQGRDNARTFLKEHTDIRAKLESALRKKLGLPAASEPQAAAPNGAEKQEKPEKPAPAIQTQAAAAGANRGPIVPAKGR
jgi:recombination protein RecA